MKKTLLKIFFINLCILNIGLAAITSDEITELRKKAEHGDADAQFSLFKLSRDGESSLITPNEAHEWFKKALAAKHNYAIAIDKAENIEKIHAETVSLFDLNEEELENALEMYFYSGLSHYTGKSTVKDFRSALSYFKFCAERGHLKSLFMLGLIYADENVIEYDPTESEKLISKVARESPLETLRWAASRAVEDKQYQINPRIGIELLKAGGDRFNDGWFYYHLSGIYARKGDLDLGMEVKARNTLAIEYGLKACALMYKDAYPTTGHLINMLGTPEQTKEFHSILKKGANSGISTAQMLLALQYIQGIPESLQRNNVKAYKWLNILLATANKNEINTHALNQYRRLLIEKMNPNEISEGKSLSQEWLEARRSSRENTH